MDRRACLRIKKQLECVVYIDNQEISATILDISENGIAFLVSPQVKLTVGLTIAITVYDEYLDINENNQLFIENVMGVISEITLQEGMWRCGCFICDPDYTEYFREQLIAHACGINQSAS